MQRTYPAVAGHSDVERFAFDPNGNMVAKVDGAGDSTLYTFDSRNREVFRRFTNSGHTVATHYTPGGNPDTIVDYRGMTTYEYGACCGQLVRVNNPDGTWLGYAYDPNKNVVERSTAWGVTRYTFDKLNRMDSVIAADGAVTRYLYNPVGNRDSVLHANGTSVGYAYDALNRLLAVRNRAPDGTIQSSFTYELNPAGIREAVLEADGSRVEYCYDDTYKLTCESRSGSHAYRIDFTYDDVGNRLTQVRDGVTTGYAYNDRDQVTSETVGGASTTYAYDGAGRLTSKTDASGTTAYGWLDNDRMVSVTGPTVSVAYAYDHEGRRVEETTAAGTKRYLIDGLLPYGQVVAETDSAGAFVAAYVYGLEHIAQERAGVTRTFAADAQGSVRQLTDAAGAVTDQYWYTAFGEELAKTGTTANEFRYVGEQADPNSGFYYLRARWMSPRVGTFVSPDPSVGEPESPATLHRYGYAGNTPMTLGDRSGRSWYTLAGLMVAVSVSNVLASHAIPHWRQDECSDTRLGNWEKLDAPASCPLNCRAGRSGNASQRTNRDKCGNKITISCHDDPDPSVGCGYVVYYEHSDGDRTLVGMCVYNPAVNFFLVRYNASGARFLIVTHVTIEGPYPRSAPKDEQYNQGTPGKLDWQWSKYDARTRLAPVPWCREGPMPPAAVDYYVEGDNSDCEGAW